MAARRPWLTCQPDGWAPLSETLLIWFKIEIYAHCKKTNRMLVRFCEKKVKWWFFKNSAEMWWVYANNSIIYTCLYDSGG